MTQEQILHEFEQQKSKHLGYSLLLDFFGMATYLIPILGELGDFLYAPFYGIAIFSMYKLRLGTATAMLGGIGGFAEELLPGLDIIPTATLMWAYTYISRREKTLRTFAKGQITDRMVVQRVIDNSTTPSLWTRIKEVFMPTPRAIEPPVQETPFELPETEIQSPQPYRKDDFV